VSEGPCSKDVANRVQLPSPGKHALKASCALETTMARTPPLPDATHRLNVLGFFCPIPVAKTRESLDRLENGAILEVLADDPETLHDMPLLFGRGPLRLLNVSSWDGQYAFLIEVVA